MKAVFEMLKPLYIPRHLSGYKYLVCAITQCVENENKVYPTLQLYKFVAEKYKVKTTQVERAIRFVRDCLYQKKEKNAYIDYFTDKKISNSELIATIVYRIKEEGL